MECCAVHRRWRACSRPSYRSATHWSTPDTTSWWRRDRTWRPESRWRVRRRGRRANRLEGAMAAMEDPAVTAATEEEHWHFPAAMFGAAIAPAKLPALRACGDAGQPDLIVHPVVDLAAPCWPPSWTSLGRLRVRTGPGAAGRRCVRRTGGTHVAASRPRTRPLRRDLPLALPRSVPPEPAGRPRAGRAIAATLPAGRPRRPQ